MHWDGKDWTPVDAAGLTALRAIHGSGPDNIWAVGDGGTVAHWDGKEWTRQPVLTDAKLLSIAVLPNEVWAGSEDGVIWHQT